MNLPNFLTFIRIVLIPVFMIFLLLSSLQPTGSYIAATIFTLAAITDTIDGYVARFQRQVTPLGQFLDPIADKLLISAALVVLVELRHLPSWVAILIIAREFAVSGVRLVAAAEGEILTASKMGKLKTISQIVAVIAIILQLPVRFLGVSLGSLLIALAVILTMVSGIEYFAKTWRVLVKY